MEKDRIEQHNAPGLRACVLAVAALLMASMLADCSGGGTVGSGFTLTPPPPCRSCVAAEYLVPGATFLGGVTAGSDGNLWFTGVTGSTGMIGRITTAGAVTEYSLGGAEPEAIVAGPGGELSFTGTGPPRSAPFFAGFRPGLIGEITTAGAVTWIGAFPTTKLGGIAVGLDGNVWCTEKDANKIGRITAGIVTEFAIPTAGSSPSGIAAGPDGNLWFTEIQGNKIGRITTAGAITEFAIPTASSGPSGIGAGPDGNLWFTELASNGIGRITTAGVVTEFAIPTAGSVPEYIVAGHDGNLWFTEFSGNNIGKITTAGAISEYALATAHSYPFGIAAGSDGNLYFTEFYSNKIGKFRL